MGSAEHLAILGRAIAALAPRRNMVGVHLVEFVDSLLIGVVANGAKRAVGFAFGLSFLRLFVVRDLLGLVVEPVGGGKAPAQFTDGRLTDPLRLAIRSSARE